MSDTPLTLRLHIINTPDLPGLAAFLRSDTPRLPGDEFTMLINVDAHYGQLVDGSDTLVHMSTTDRQRMVISSLMHEFGHVLEEILGLPPDESHIEGASHV